jgi:hypothetical protein
MSHWRTAAALLLTAGTLGAQAPVDLNSLALAAKTYTSHRLEGPAQAATLDLRLMRGDNGGDPTTLMATAGDVRRWTVFYDATYPKTETEEVVERPGSASVKCIKGVFSSYQTAKHPIPGVKTMESAWLAVSLDGAIAQLNANGYSRGFSEVSVKRIDQPNITDEPAYVFTCPWERTKVAISCTTGNFIWYQMF